MSPLESRVSPGQSRGLALATNKWYHRKTSLSAGTVPGALGKWVQQGGDSSSARLPRCKHSTHRSETQDHHVSHFFRASVVECPQAEPALCPQGYWALLPADGCFCPTSGDWDNSLCEATVVFPG